MSRPLGLVMGMPTHRMGKPTDEIRKLSLRFGANYEMPVIGHQAKRINWQRLSFKSFPQHTLKGFVVRFFFEQRQSGHCSIEHMKASIRRANSRSSGHSASLPHSTHQKRAASPFLRPPFSAPLQVESGGSCLLVWCLSLMKIAFALSIGSANNITNVNIIQPTAIEWLHLYQKEVSPCPYSFDVFIITAREKTNQMKP
jgi:hypothetical protein